MRIKSQPFCTRAVVDFPLALLSALSHQAGLKCPAHWLRNFNEKVPLKMKNLPDGRCAILGIRRTPFHRRKSMAYSRRSCLGRSPAAQSQTFEVLAPGTGELIGSLNAHASKRA
jgi:hypothetical protein